MFSLVTFGLSTIISEVCVVRDNSKSKVSKLSEIPSSIPLKEIQLLLGEEFSARLPKMK